MTDLLTGAAVSAPLAWLVWRRGHVTRAAALTGVACAGVIYAGTYLAGLAVLLVALVLTLASTRAGLARKRARGIAEANGGRRGTRNVIANCGVGTAAAAAEACGYAFGPDLNAAMFVAGIAAGASDTVASEIGKAWGGEPRAVPSMLPVAAGTPGAISLIGTLAGAAGASLIALPAVLLWLVPPDFLLPIVGACTAGAVVESALATRYEARGWIGNDALNAINTAVAAGLALWWCAA